MPSAASAIFACGRNTVHASAMRTVFLNVFLSVLAASWPLVKSDLSVWKKTVIFGGYFVI